MKSEIDKLREKTPYPKDVFRPLNSSELKQIQRAIERIGFTLDGLSAHLSRIIEKNTYDKLEALIHERIREYRKQQEEAKENKKWGRYNKARFRIGILKELAGEPDKTFEEERQEVIKKYGGEPKE